MIGALLLGLASVACSFAAGWYWGTRHCARKHHCLIQQMHDTKEWTDGLTREMRDRIAQREKGDR